MKYLVIPAILVFVGCSEPERHIGGVDRGVTSSSTGGTGGVSGVPGLGGTSEGGMGGSGGAGGGAGCNTVTYPCLSAYPYGYLCDGFVPEGCVMVGAAVPVVCCKTPL